jgi:hypothetical protein
MQLVPLRWNAALRTIACKLLLVLPCIAFAATAPGTPHAIDLDGHAVMLAPSTASAIVLFFTASDCPIANRYEPEMLRLEQKFAPSGVQFWWVYPNPDDTAAVVRRHQSQFTASGRVILDTQQQFVHAAHATVTPEAAVFIPTNGALREIYRGRIDDKYIAFGEERPTAMHHELDDAIAAALAGHTVVPPGGPPIGCSIVPLETRSRP